ncbi:hypothetical protein AB0K09_00545 [Streptomyces sp. NPDC049577]|uniref:hypothetical protein n=1 Tax=Streptomyces sp. NPDC049577 TaxID=3155153 RepID=UPI0034225385
MHYNDVTPDMTVLCPSRGDKLDAKGIVLHKRAAPEGESPTAVFVEWYLGAPSWVPAEELVDTGEMPHVPHLIEVPDAGSRETWMFWRRGNEYRVFNTMSGDGHWAVARRAEDGTLSTFVTDSHTRQTAHRAAMTALYGFEDMASPVESYLVEAQPKGYMTALRCKAEGADEFGRVAAATPEEGLRAFDGCKSGMRYDVIKKKSVRNRIHSFLIYPVRRDGSVGIPRYQLR